MMLPLFGLLALFFPSLSTISLSLFISQSELTPLPPALCLPRHSLRDANCRRAREATDSGAQDVACGDATEGERVQYRVAAGGHG